MGLFNNERQAQCGNGSARLGLGGALYDRDYATQQKLQVSAEAEFAARREAEQRASVRIAALQTAINVREHGEDPTVTVKRAQAFFDFLSG